ncbi:alpha/beta-gliadin-like [Rana temporaria]|uniref:alpha/beta-gliadin-like n=1 Tax=Rana temporaria TaxID=8407 RepID=UPI001AAD3C24|nr:alpha/beta-gliadin-like [Rana temporaria]
MKIALAFLLVSLSSCFTLPVDKKDEPAVPVPKVPESVPKSEPKVPETEPKPVPKEPQPVPKQPEPVPKQPEPVPKQPEPVPKQPEPVPKQPEPVPKKPEPVPKQPQPVPKQPQPVPKQPQPAPKPRLDCLIQLLKKDAPALLQNLGTLLCNYRVAQREQNVAYFMSFLEQVDNILKQVGCSLNNLLGFNVKINAANAENLAKEVSLILFQFMEDIIERVMKILAEIPILGDFVNDIPLTKDVRDLACSVLQHYLNDIIKVLNVIADVTGGLTQIIEGL